jgi:hypothetical protein
LPLRWRSAALGKPMRPCLRAAQAVARVPLREIGATQAPPAVAQVAHLLSRPILAADPAATVPIRTPPAFSLATARVFAELRANPSACASNTRDPTSVAPARSAAKASVLPSTGHSCSAHPQPASTSGTNVSSMRVTAMRIVQEGSALQRVSLRVGLVFQPLVLETRIAARNPAVPARTSISDAAKVVSAARPSATLASPACIRATAASWTPIARAASAASSARAGLAVPRAALEAGLHSADQRPTRRMGERLPPKRLPGGASWRSRAQTDFVSSPPGRAALSSGAPDERERTRHHGRQCRPRLS